MNEAETRIRNIDPLNYLPSVLMHQQSKISSLCVVLVQWLNLIIDARQGLPVLPTTVNDANDEIWLTRLALGTHGTIYEVEIRTQSGSDRAGTWTEYNAAVYKAGMFTMIGEQMRQIYIWNCGGEEVSLGPSMGIGADVLGDVFMALKKGEAGRAFRIPARLARPPLAGPSVQQLINWADGGDAMPPKPISTGRGRRAMPQRPTLQRIQLR